MRACPVVIYVVTYEFAHIFGAANEERRNTKENLGSV